MMAFTDNAIVVNREFAPPLNTCLDTTRMNRVTPPLASSFTAY
jgi:hypothetical protein